MRVVLCGMYPEEEGRIIGGVEAVTWNLAQELGCREEIDLHIVTVRRTNGRDDLRQVGNYKVHLLAKANRLPFSLRVTGADPKRVQAKLHEIQPDIVHAHGIDAHAIAALKGHYPTLLCIHGVLHRDVLVEMNGPWDWMRYLQMVRLENICLRRAEYIAAISRYVTQAYGSRIHARVDLIENPITDAFFEVPPVQPTRKVLFAGYIRPLKGVHFLVDAFIEVAKQVPDAELRLAGSVVDKEYADNLKRKVEEHGLAERIKFLGLVPAAGMKEEYAKAQVVCLPSQQENSPMVVQQAMAAGRPVVATRIAGVPGLVAEGKTGFLTAPGDIPATTEALCRLLQDFSLSEQMGQAGKQAAEERFRLRIIGDKTIALYQEIIAAKA